jgi:hypothetical protein
LFVEESENDTFDRSSILCPPLQK